MYDDLDDEDLPWYARGILTVGAIVLYSPFLLGLGIMHFNMWRKGELPHQIKKKYVLLYTPHY